MDYLPTNQQLFDDIYIIFILVSQKLLLIVQKKNFLNRRYLNFNIKTLINSTQTNDF